MGNLTIKQKLTKLIQRGVSFTVSDSKLLVRGDLSKLDEDDKKFLKDNKQTIISLIQDQIQDTPGIQRITDRTKPLSFSQRNLWLLDKINNGSKHYNITSAFKLKGRINLQVINQTFKTILERHESLRTSFIVDETNEPIQKVQPVNNFNIEIEDVDTSLDDHKFQVRQKLEEEKHRIFDLTKDVLLNVRLLLLSEEEHVLILNMHHIAADGWSMGILVKEFNQLYTAYCNKEANPLPTLKIQYSDYAYWEQQWFKGAVLEKHLKYWKDQLTDLPAVHNLQLDRPRPVEQSFNGNTFVSQIDKSTLDSLYDLCKSEGASLFMGIHAAFSTLLARYSNETDIVVGSPIANRENVETADLVGFFMNLLVLRSDLSKKPGFRQLVKQSKKVLEEAYEYQQIPFEKIVKELKVKKNLSHNPLFQILLSLHNNQEEEFSLSNLKVEPVENENNSAKYDLSLIIKEKTDGLHLSWEYNTGLFDESTIIRLSKHFNILLASLIENPDENVFKVDIIEKNDIEEVYKNLIGENYDIDKEDHVIASFDHQVKNASNKIAVISNDISYSYKQLSEKVDAIANVLQEQGVQPGDKVGVSLLRNIELVASIFACFKVGAIYIPLDPVYSSERIKQIIDDAAPKCILTLTPLKEIHFSTLPDVNFVCLDTVNYTKSNKKVSNEFDLENVAYIIFTSGTTGKPKGIELTHQNLSNLLKGFDVSFDDQTKQKWLAQTSINFDISVLELIWTISRGQTIVLQQTNAFKLLPSNYLKVNKKIDFSIMFFGADDNNDPDKYDLLLKTAKFADENDFKAIWTPERHFGEFGGAFSNPSVLSSALSVLTKKINIRSGSVVLPLHDPIRVAEEWSIVDNLSNGRIGISIASGWQPNDFVIQGSDYLNRHRIMREKITELKDLWKGNPVVRKDGVDKDFSIKIRPVPKQKELPIWITAAGNPQTFKYAGEIGANLLTHMLGQSLEKLEANIAVYHQALLDNGHKIEDKMVSLMLHTYIDDTEEMALRISKKPFKKYLGSSLKLMEPLAQELGLDIQTQSEELIEIAFKKFSKENTLIGSPESCQEMLYKIQNIGVTEVACLVDFGVEKDKAFKGLQHIVQTKNINDSYSDLAKILNPDNQKTELDLINDHEITHVQMTPSQSKLIVDIFKQTENKTLSSVKHWFIGGEAINQQLIKDLSRITNSKFYNMYGPTETTVWSAWREINQQDIHIGKPIINTDLLLLNEYEQPVPIGVVGELYIGGLGVAKGYFNNEELTNKSFKNINNTIYPNKRYYKTGDLMKLNADGTFEYVGRKDNQVKVNGYRIELEEIEKTVSKVPGIKNCKVLPVGDNYDIHLSAYLVKEDVAHGSYTELPEKQQAKPFHFPDGSLIYHQSDRQLAMLYKEVIEDGIYFKHGISIPENGLVLDLGANIGTFSIDVNKRYPNATVIAFEPIPQIFSALKKNFEHRQINGRVLNYGVSHKKETTTFYYYPEMSGMSGRFADGETIVEAIGSYIEHDKTMLQEGKGDLSEHDQKVVQSLYESIDSSENFSDEVKQYLSSLYVSEEVECQLTTISDVIDEFNIQTIDLLKLDVEKSECLVLEGIRSEHWPMIRHLAIEVDGDHSLTFITGLLKEKGYEIKVDDLILGDSNTQNEENTYMLYATNHNHGVEQNQIVTEQLKVKVNQTTITEFLKKSLPDYMVPKDMIFVPTIPLMENGKVDRVKLKQIKPEKTSSQEIVKLVNNTELTIYSIWCEVLKKENIPPQVSIFEAGGNSMEIVLLHEKLQSRFNVKFSLIELFRNPTIQQQAKLVRNANNEEETKTIKRAVDKGAARRKARTNRLK